MGHRIGLIAGRGEITCRAVEEARRLGYRIAVAGIKGEAPKELKKKADEFRWIEFGRLKQVVDFFKESGINQVIMAGKINHNIIYQENIYWDETALKLLKKVKEKTPATLLKTLISYFLSQGIEFKDIAFLMEKYFPKEGVFTADKPSSVIMENIEFGWEIAKKIAFLDIGQTVVVKDKAVVAVEGMEGTDETVLRASKLAGPGTIVVKVSRPAQDMRFDVPVVGLSTVKRICQVKGKALCIEAEKTIFLDQEESIALANKNKVSIVVKKGSSRFEEGI
ncbi:MAG: LpxI family protein [Candidatus Aminicenantia bacterium]